MYLSINGCFELDKIVKSFEVSYRSFIVDSLKTKYNSLNNFSIEINRINSLIERSPVLFSLKYKAKSEKIIQEVAAHYKRIEDCQQAYLNQDYNNQVPYVSEIIDYVTLFFNDCFNNLAIGFSSLEEFNSLNTKYNQLRNWLSHPASSKISTDDGRSVVSFIKKISQNIDTKYFWFIPRRELFNLIDSFLVNIEFSPIKYHNLNDVSFVHSKIVEREDELAELGELIFGKGAGYRKSGSVVIYGYGGVGKTAIVLEYLYRLTKDINDKKIKEQVDFILFFTSKEELLSYSETTKKLYVREIRKQIISFDDFIDKLIETLSLKRIETLKSMKGIIAIDNFETIQDVDKAKFFDFIKSNPRSIQFILTSRNEEQSEDKIHLKEYSEIEKGKKFISEYIETFELKIKISDAHKADLINLSKGNTLIIVLSLQLISNNYPIENILSDLQGVESGNIGLISDFMYKNTINHSIDFLLSKNHDPINLLKVISLYDVPIDLYSLSKLSNTPVSSVEFVCEYLSTKLILEKKGETFKANEFANKFIISKFLPNRVELKKLKENIWNHQKELDSKLKKFEQARKQEPLLNGIMEDWKPRNSIDKVAISEAFLLFGSIKKALEDNDDGRVTAIKEEFKRLEKMTSHPYIRYQKARCLQLILSENIPADDRQELQDEISKYFEEAIEITDFYYPFIKNTKSYASINWIYGIFLSSVLFNLERSLRYLEDSVIIFKKLGVKDKAYFTAVNNLSWVYSKLFEQTNDKAFLIELKRLVDEVHDNKRYLINIDFKYNLYMLNFKKYFRQNSGQSKPIGTRKV